MVVLVRGRTVGEWLSGQSTVDLSWETDNSLTDEDKRKRYAELYGEFVADLVSWNLEDDQGVPVPVTMAGLESVGASVGWSFVVSWVHRKVKVPDPLVNSSPSGEQLDLSRIPMEVATGSPAS